MQFIPHLFKCVTIVLFLGGRLSCRNDTNVQKIIRAQRTERCARIMSIPPVLLLLADHDVKDHAVGALHADRPYLSEIPDGLLDVLFDDAVMLGNAVVLASQDR